MFRQPQFNEKKLLPFRQIQNTVSLFIILFFVEIVIVVRSVIMPFVISTYYI